MKISTKGRYALRLMLELALHDANQWISVKEIAKNQEISGKYLEQIITQLHRAMLVQSVRGAQGGYKLARPAGEISVGDVLRALEGSLDAVTCNGGGEHSCQGADLCVTRYVWQRINNSIKETVDSIMLDQLVEESRRMRDKGQIQVQKCDN